MMSGCAAPPARSTPQLVNLSSDGFRLRSADPLEVGWVVTLEARRTDPVKAVICWACGLEAGGVFAEAVALSASQGSPIGIRGLRPSFSIYRTDDITVPDIRG